MATAWRIVKHRHAVSAFDGEGARTYGGRWNSPGVAVVYASETRALALLEILAGIRSTQPLDSYVLIPTRFEQQLVTTLAFDDLPGDWRQSPPPPATRRIGDRWVADQRSAVLRVPSIIVPGEFNYVLNPGHPAFGQIEVDSPQSISLDPRLSG